MPFQRLVKFSELYIYSPNLNLCLFHWLGTELGMRTNGRKICNENAWAFTYLPRPPNVHSFCPKVLLLWWIETHTQIHNKQTGQIILLYNSKYSHAGNFSAREYYHITIGVFTFHKQGLILKLRMSSALKFAKFSCREIFLLYTTSIPQVGNLRDSPLQGGIPLLTSIWVHR